MSAPRNRVLFEQGQLRRQRIAALLQAHSPLARPLSPDTIAEQLKCSRRQVQRHLQAIRAELAK